MLSGTSKRKYDAYISSDQWKGIREARLRRDRYTCQGCGARDGLHVHHRTYERFTRERISDLVTVCSTCHSLIHDTHRKVLGSLSDTTTSVLKLMKARKSASYKQRKRDRRQREKRNQEFRKLENQPDWRYELRDNAAWARNVPQVDKLAAARRQNGLLYPIESLFASGRSGITLFPR